MEINWLFAIIALVIGLLIGFGIATFRRRDPESNEAKVERLDSELKAYREEVSDHFVKTAALVNNLTQSYKEVYDHLEGGAYKLVDDQVLQEQLGMVDAEPVMLEYIGHRRQPEAAIHATSVADHEESNEERLEAVTEVATTDKASIVAETEAEAERREQAAVVEASSDDSEDTVDEDDSLADTEDKVKARGDIT